MFRVQPTQMQFCQNVTQTFIQIGDRCVKLPAQFSDARQKRASTSCVSQSQVLLCSHCKFTHKPIRLLIPHTLTDPNQHKPLLSPLPRSSSHYTPWLCSVTIPETLLSNPMSINTYHEDCSLVSGAGQPTRHFNSEDGCPISEGTIRKASKGLSPQGSDGFCYFSSSLTDVSVK